MNPLDLPLEAQIWTAADCAAYFQETRAYFLRNRRYDERFPRPLLMSSGMRPRWSAKAVIGYALRS